MSRWPMLLLVLCACALGLAACGGGDDDDVDTILSETFGEGKDVKSGRLDVSLRLNAQGLAQLQGPLALRLNGPFESTGQTELPHFDFEASIDAGGQQIKAGAISTGEKGFLELQGQAYDVGEELYKQFKDGYAQTAKCNAENNKGENQGSFAALGIDPSRWLTDAEKAGEEEVGGAETTHVSGRVDVPKFLDDVNRIISRSDPQQQSADPCAEDGEQQEQEGESGSDRPRQLTEEQRKQIANAIKDARVDIWSGNDDRMLRRMNVTLKFEVPEGEREQAGGLQSGDLRFDMTIGALNEEQNIEAPENARPLEELQAALGGAAPQGASGQGGSGGGSSGGATGGTPYEQCLNEAGQDVKKLQECAELIGQ